MKESLKKEFEEYIGKLIKEDTPDKVMSGKSNAIITRNGTYVDINKVFDWFESKLIGEREDAVREFERLVNNIRRFDDKEDGANYFAGWDNALDTLQTDIKDYLKSKSGGIPAKKKNGTLDLRYKKNIETLEKQRVI